MPKYLITIKEVSECDVPQDKGSHDSVQFAPATQHAQEKFLALVVPSNAAAFATLQSSILTAIGTAEA